jgi:hypothetical protein
VAADSAGRFDDRSETGAVARGEDTLGRQTTGSTGIDSFPGRNASCVSSGSMTITGVPVLRISASSLSSLFENHARSGSERHDRASAVAVLTDETITRSNPSVATRSALVDEWSAPSTKERSPMRTGV